MPMEKDESVVVFSLQTTAMDSMTRYLIRQNSGTYIIGINNSCLICDNRNKFVSCTINLDDYEGWVRPWCLEEAIILLLS